VLYGGITEEVLLRWGVMTLIAWLGWRFVQGGAGAVRARWIWMAIIVSALLFGAGHLPAVAAQTAQMDASLAAFVVLANTVFGVIFGFVYWRRGIEAAMLAHGIAHIVASVLAKAT
uniref:CPBP family intramembrane glutamic endopeptidase n=1 Tax=Noviherbaspirillum sp. TaxID=1926288 RepID=UPI002FE1CAAC